MLTSTSQFPIAVLLGGVTAGLYWLLVLRRRRKNRKAAREHDA